MCVYTCLNRLFCGKQAAIDAFHTPTCADQNIRAKADVILPFILVRMSKTKGTVTQTPVTPVTDTISL